MSEEDAFSRFVGSLADALNEPELRGPELAARLYLSRSHFDRLVTARRGSRRPGSGAGSFSSGRRSGCSAAT